MGRVETFAPQQGAQLTRRTTAIGLLEDLLFVGGTKLEWQSPSRSAIAEEADSRLSDSIPRLAR